MYILILLTQIQFAIFIAASSPRERNSPRYKVALKQTKRMISGEQNNLSCSVFRLHTLLACWDKALMKTVSKFLCTKDLAEVRGRCQQLFSVLD
jgi:hypothetical protein